jgi:nitrogenase molybdenum-iron protein NifN
MRRQKMKNSTSSVDQYKVTKNACKLCAPLGACFAFKGVEGCIPLVHGSQGCATYIRRYMISHYREPVDIASSNFSENTAIYGGSDNLTKAIYNINKQYEPKVIGIASTCLSETIGDDVRSIVNDIRKSEAETMCEIVDVSTPSYSGSHAEGYRSACREIVKRFAYEVPRNSTVTVIPGMFSPADIRYLKDILEDFEIEGVVVPDYSDTLDGPLWREYQKIPTGGTPVEELKKIGGSSDAIEFTTVGKETSVTKHLLQNHGVEPHVMNYPIGIEESDAFFELLAKISKKSIPLRHLKSRGRLLDAIVDSHKHTASIKTLVYGEEDLIYSMAKFVTEIGLNVVAAASGGKSGALKKSINAFNSSIEVLDDVDFTDITKAAKELGVELIIGNSKGYKTARELDIPLVRTGFPIHDRMGGQRVLHIGYDGALSLFDRIVNARVAFKQNKSAFGYTYQ